MLKPIEELEVSLKDQLDSLTKDIRSMESALITTKEGYLKVQGALEILNILKKKIEDEGNRKELPAIGLD